VGRTSRNVLYRRKKLRETGDAQATASSADQPCILTDVISRNRIGFSERESVVQFRLNGVAHTITRRFELNYMGLKVTLKLFLDNILLRSQDVFAFYF
jgi:hypothetical protein